MKKNVKYIVIGIIMFALIIGYYYYLSNRKETPTEDNVKISKVTELLMMNISKDYPPTPKEVVKLYADITVAFYTEDYTDEEFVALANKIQELYDDELIANKPYDQYINDLRAEVNAMREAGGKISSYATSSSTDVEYFNHNGYKCARLNVAFTARNSAKEAQIVKETFILRKDADGHYKIYGWALAKDDE